MALSPATAPTARLGDLLVEFGYLGRVDVERAQTRAEETGRRLGLVLAELGLLTEAELVAVLSHQLGIAPCDPVSTPIPPDVLARVPRESALVLRAIPIGFRATELGEVLCVATSDPLQPGLVDELVRLTREHVELWLAGETELELALLRHYGPRRPTLRVPSDTGSVQIVRGEPSGPASAAAAPLAPFAVPLSVGASGAGVLDPLQPPSAARAPALPSRALDPVAEPDQLSAGLMALERVLQTLPEAELALVHSEDLVVHMEEVVEPSPESSASPPPPGSILRSAEARPGSLAPGEGASWAESLVSTAARRSLNPLAPASQLPTDVSPPETVPRSLEAAGPRSLEAEAGPRSLEAESGPRSLEAEAGPRSLEAESATSLEGDAARSLEPSFSPALSFEIDLAEPIELAGDDDPFALGAVAGALTDLPLADEDRLQPEASMTWTRPLRARNSDPAPMRAAPPGPPLSAPMAPPPAIGPPPSAIGPVASRAMSGGVSGTLPLPVQDSGLHRKFTRPSSPPGVSRVATARAVLEAFCDGRPQSPALESWVLRCVLALMLPELSDAELDSATRRVGGPPGT